MNTQYQSKLISAVEAAGLVRSGMWLDYGAICGFPSLIDQKLSERASELKNVKIRGEHSHTCIPQIDPNQEHFIYNSWFLGRLERQFSDRGACSYIPFNLGEGPRMYREWLRDEVDITFIEVAPLDSQGYFNFGAATTRQKAATEAAKMVVLEVNPYQPCVYGGFDERIHISEVDYIVENNEYMIPEFPLTEITPTDRLVARHLTELIADGSTIQLGVGAVPNAVGKLLIEHGFRDLGIHSEMFSDAMMEMMEAGVVTGAAKMIDRGKAVFCFAAGTRRLYEFLDHNLKVAGYPSDYTNNADIIRQNHGQIAINSALRVDLKGQVCSETVGARHISGTGGQLDFTRGAYLSPGGKGFICMHATRQDKSGNLISAIVPTLERGDTVTVPATDTFYIATEYGVVNLKGRTQWERARLLISVAHPDFRDELERAARQQNLIPKSI
ncbi:acetyl-CoA hydrolase/transferase family protein [Chloroflexota bacterium]